MANRSYGSTFLTIRHVGEKLVQVERLRGGGRYFQHEIEQLGALAESNWGFARCGWHGLLYV
jgi:hypothetical protein